MTSRSTTFISWTKQAGCLASNQSHTHQSNTYKQQEELNTGTCESQRSRSNWNKKNSRNFEGC